MRDNNEMDKIQEWQEHQYNPFYWVNRISPLFPPKKTLGSWITNLLGLFLSLPAFLAFGWSYFAERNIESLLLALIFGTLSLVMTLLTIRLRPGFNKKKSQIEAKELNRSKKQKRKKKLPKRRKDYR
jgi:hypothetical protein